MEDRKAEDFPWIKSVIQSFAASFMIDYDNDTLSILHRNIDNEIKLIYSSNEPGVERAENLFTEILFLYEHMRLKISQHPDFENATLSCVKLISQLIRISLFLTQGFTKSEWIERILTAIKLFPGKKVLVYDALLLVNGLKKIHYKPYSIILKNIMIEDHHEFITDPLVYMEMILLFRRLKALVLNRHKEKYTTLVTKIKPPTNLMSWLASLDVNGYSSYLKKLRYKKIALQLMKKILPESFIKMIRYMALNQYNFEVPSNEFNKTQNEELSDLFVIDNASNLDIYVNSEKALSKKVISKAKKKKKLQLDNNMLNDISIHSNDKGKISNTNESGANNSFQNSHKSALHRKKQMSKFMNSREHVIVSKKKNKFKDKLIKKAKSKISDSKDISGSGLFLHVNDNNSLPLNEVTQNEKNLESVSSCKSKTIKVLDIGSDQNTSNNKYLPNLKKHTSKKKQKSKSKCNHADKSKSITSFSLNENILDVKCIKLDSKKPITNVCMSKSETVASSEDVDALFFFDMQGNSTSSQKLKIACNSNSAISPKRNVSEDTDNSTTKKEPKKKKRLKSSKNNETSNNVVPSNSKLDSNITSHHLITCKDNDNNQGNSFEINEDVIFVSETPNNKRKKVASNDDSSASEDKHMYFKKLMLKKVNEDSKKDENIVNITKKSTQENSLEILSNENIYLKNKTNNLGKEKCIICELSCTHGIDGFNYSSFEENINNLAFKKENDLIVQPSKSIKIPKVANVSPLNSCNQTTIKEPNEKKTENINSELEVKNNILEDEIPHVLSNMDYSDVKNELKRSEQALKSDKILNKDSSLDYSDLDVSKNCDKESFDDKCVFNISDSSDLSNMTNYIANQLISDKSIVKCIVTVSTPNCSFVASDNSECNENVNNSLIENNSCSTSDVSSFKTSINLADNEACQREEKAKNNLTACDTLSDPTPLDSKQSEEELSCDNSVKSVLNKEYSVKSSAVEFESNLKLTGDIISNESFNKTLCDKISNNHILYSTDKQEGKNVQNIVSNQSKIQHINICSGVAENPKSFEYEIKCSATLHAQHQYQHGEEIKESVNSKLSDFDSQIKNESLKDPFVETIVCGNGFNQTSPELENVTNIKQKSKREKAEFVKPQETLHLNQDKEINLDIENNIEHPSISIEIQENNYESKDIQLLGKLNNKPSMLINEALGLHESSPFSPNSSKFSGEGKNCLNEKLENSVEMKDSQNSTVINSENNVPNKNILSLYKSSCSNYGCNSASNDKISVDRNKNILQAQIYHEEVTSLSYNSEKTNINCSQDAVFNDNKNNPANDAETFVKEKQLGLRLPKLKEINNRCENSEKVNVVKSQENIVQDNGNSKENYSGENILSSNNSACTDIINMLVNEVETSVKEKEINLQLLPESKNINSLNSDKTAIKINNENNSPSNNILSTNQSICSDNQNNSVNDIQTSAEKIGDFFFLLPESKEPIDFQDENIGSKDNVGDLFNKNTLSPIKSVCSDSVSKSITDNKIPVKEKDTLQLSFESENIEKTDEVNNSTSSQSSDNQNSSVIVVQTSVIKVHDSSFLLPESKEPIDFQNENIGKKNNVDNLSNENTLTPNKSVFSDSISKSIIDNEIPLKKAKDMSQLALESENAEKTDEINNSTSSHSSESKGCKTVNFPRQKSKDCECVSDLESQEEFIVVDESFSDIDDCKSNYSEKSTETLSPNKAAGSNNKLKCEENTSSDEGNNEHLCKNSNESLKKNDSSELLLEICTNEKDHSISTMNVDTVNESKFKPDICSKNVKVEPILKINNCEASLETCAKEINSMKLPESNLSDKKKDLLMLVDDEKCSLEYNNSKKKFISDASDVKNGYSSSALKTEASIHEIKCASVDKEIAKKNLLKAAESIFSVNETYESFSEISFKNKDKSIYVESTASIPINNFSSSASTELFSMYRNKVLHDEEKTEASVSSKDDILSTCHENDEIKSQCLSSDHSDDEIESKCSDSEEEIQTTPSNENNTHSRNVDESFSIENVPSTAKTEDDSFIDENCSKNKSLNISNTAENTHELYEENSDASTVPRQSLRLKSKADSENQTNMTENDTVLEKDQELSKKELKIILTDCKSSLNDENKPNNSSSSVEKVTSCPLTPEKNKNIISIQESQKSVSKSKIKSKIKSNSISNISTDKRYSLRHRKSNISKDDSANLGIDLNKLKFDSSNNKNTKTRIESKFVKFLTSDVKLQDSNCGDMPSKRETRSSTAKCDVGIEPNTPSYNLRNRKSIIAPPKLKV